jgi:hypothetical protein
MYFRKYLPVALVGLILCGIAHANVARVPTDYSTIQAAINNTPDGGIIEVSAGVYVGFIQALNLNKNIYLRSVDGPGAAVISGNNTLSLLRIENDAQGDANRTLIFDGFTFENGRETAGLAGSPIVIANASPTFINCTFQNNQCFERAGAVLIYGARSAPTFTDCVFRNNSSDRLAGAVLINGDRCQAIFKRCLFENNTSRTDNGTDWNHGGAIYVASASVKIYDSTFIGNSARYAGGAVMLLNGWDDPEETIEIVGSRFFNNYVLKEVAGTPPPTEGGAIMAEDNLHVIIDRCLFSGNWAEAGGAIHSYRAHMTIRDSVITNNTATGVNGMGYGGAIGININDAGGPQRRPAQIAIQDTLIKDCTAPVGGGIYAAGNGSHGILVPITMQNVTIDSCSALDDNNSLGVGGALFLQLANVTGTGLALLNNWADWVGGGLAIIQNTSLSLTDAYIIGNDGSAQGDIHNPDNLPIQQNNVIWAFNPSGSATFELLRATPRVTVQGAGHLTYLKSPFGSGVEIAPQVGALPNQGGYTVGSVSLPGLLVGTTFTLTPSSPLQQDIINYDAGSFTNIAHPGPALPVPPARIQAEDFDRGGEGLAYHDTTPANIGGAYRPSEGVDILTGGGSDGNGFVGFIQAGEWLEYSVNAEELNRIELAVRYASPTGARIAVDVDGAPWIQDWQLPATGDWGNWSEAEKSELPVDPGVRRIRFRMLTGGMNLDWLEVTPSFTNSVLSVSRNQISLFAVSNSTVAASSFTVRNEGIGTINYTISNTTQTAWLNISPTSGTSSGQANTIQVNYNIANLQTGIYAAVLTVHSDAEVNPTQTINVSLQIRDRGAVMNDFDGDGFSDIGIFRPSEVTWYVFQSTAGPMAPFQFGTIGDIPVPADYDGDGLTDLAVFRPSTVTWYIFGSSSGPLPPFQFGTIGDLPVPADYDGDGVADLAIYRPSTMEWFVFGSSVGPIPSFVFGAPGDIPVPADYDGDGRADLAIFRPSTSEWFVFGSSAGPMPPFVFGGPGDIPVPGDYDGDGIVDKAIFRPSNVTWLIFGSSAGPLPPFQFGTLGDLPIR